MAAATPTTWTIKALLAWTANYLKEKGIESPRLEAELLLAHALKTTRIDLIVRFNEEPDEAARTAYRELVKRRSEHWPTAYLVGTREFFLLPFTVSPAVLIPRPETETLLITALEFLKGKESPRILDLGTGSGCLAVSIAIKIPSAFVVAVDVSPDAIEVAQANAAKHGVSGRVEFRRGDLFSPVSGETFTAIVSNPPYITTGEIATLQGEVKDHEPRTALDGGPDGLAFYRRIAAEAGNYLAPGGGLFAEIGFNQESAVRAIFEASVLKIEKVVKDGASISRVIDARLG